MRTMDHQMEDDFDDGMDRGSGRDHGMGRASYRSIESEAPLPAPEPRDLTLGLTALLGIFFAVVLVCAVFFGFGYSTGRTLHGAKSSTTPSAQASEAAGSDATLARSTPAPTLVSAQPLGKPSAGAPATIKSESPAATDDASGEAEGFPDSAPAGRSAVAGTPSHAEPASAALRMDQAATAYPPLTGGMMVQIAAVMRPADADMLAQALRSNGFAAVVRTEPKDKFLHVQVGPFATRDQARAMRAKLEADGYNAFLKP